MRMVRRAAAVGVVAFVLPCVAWGGKKKPVQQPADAVQAETASAPVTPAMYTIHPGDQLTLIFRYTPEFNEDVLVPPDGTLVLRATGPITVTGLTIAELQREIVAKSTDKLVNPDVAVSLKDFVRPVVTVAGEVANPQRIEMRKAMTALQAILTAGGAKEDAALGHVILFRRVNDTYAEVHVLDLRGASKNAVTKNDVQLQPDDMILLRRDALSHIERYVKLVNIGTYFNLLGNNGIF